MSRFVWSIASILAAALVLVIVLASGIGGLLYGVLYAVTLMPGLPIGFALFGRRHGAGWIAGAALGYFITTLALWLAIALGLPSILTFIAGWMLALALTWVSTRRVATPLVSLPTWTERDTAAWVTVLLLVPVIAGPPFVRLGARDANGNRYYRAYFTADFVWHMAVTSELKKFAMPPRNMYMPHRPLHYYWAYYLVPSAIAGTGPRQLANVESDLKVNAIGTALLLVSTMFLAAWTSVPHAFGAAAGVTLATVASSAEGTIALLRLVNRGTPLGAVRNLNIDAISNWWFGGLRVDGIPRCFWWVPQHSMSYILGLVALAVVNASGSGAGVAAYWVAGAALAGSIAFNPFVGAIFAVVSSVALALDASISPDPVRRLARCAAVGVPILAALGWCVGNQMVGRAPGMLEVGLLGGARSAPVANLSLSLGPALVPALAGIFAARSIGRSRAIVAPVLMVIVALIVMHFVRLRVDESWVGFRAGQMMLAVIPCLTAGAFAAAQHWRRVAVALASAALIVGLPTTIIDLYNAQDITNLAPGPGFPWTQVLDRAHDDAVGWLRQTTPATAVVQLDAVARGRTTWSLIPSFAERRMSAGLPRTLVDDPEYHARSERVRVMYATADAREAWTIARLLRVDYIWVDEVERAAYPAGVKKFEEALQYFAPAYRNDEVVIYRVQ
jgi:hypothetical protein